MRFVHAVGIAVAIGIVQGGCAASTGGGKALQPCRITLTISNGQIADPGPFTCRHNSPVRIGVDDQDRGGYTVELDPASVYDRKNPNNRNPFVEVTKVSASPRGGGHDELKLTVKGNAVPSTYKYTVTWTGSGGHGTLDPDIEIAQ